MTTDQDFPMQRFRFPNETDYEYIVRLEAEVERLRAERESFQRIIRSQSNAAAALNDEVERLRAAAEPEYERLHLALAQCEAENERLDKARHAAIEIIAKQNDDVLRLVAKTERLRVLVREAMGNVSADWFKRARQALEETT
jgi:predicted negative regulator of RcsB-dependent stress response